MCERNKKRERERDGEREGGSVFLSVSLKV